MGLVVHFSRNILRKPSIVTVEKQKEVSLIELSRDAKDRLKVTYQNEPVSDFHLTLLEVRNKSDLPIENILLKIYLSQDRGKQKLYEMVIDDPLEDLRQPPAGIGCVVEDSGAHHLLLSLPWLNDARRDKDGLSIRIFSPEPITVERVVGGGKGWTVRFFDRVAYNKKLESIVRNSTSASDLILNSLNAGLMKKWR